MEILEKLRLQNPWWSNRKINRIAGLKERYLKKEVERYLKKPQILAILGLRRVGKTVLMHQLISHLLDSVDARRIMYFSFDDLASPKREQIEEVLNLYQETILKEELSNVYIFLDEINNIEDWQSILKVYYDLSKGIKFVVSGSRSVLIKKSKESLAGRIYEFELGPLGFKEYLYLKGVEIDDIELQSTELKLELSRYIINGSFPEIMKNADFEETKRYTATIVDKIIFQDIPQIYDVNRPEILKELLALVSRKPGMIIEHKALADALNVNQKTISKYVHYLEKAFLIKLLYNYRGSPVASARKAKKAYLTAHSVFTAFAEREEDLFANFEAIAENLAVMHSGSNFFWKAHYEVDILKDKYPIEIKYKNKVRDREIKGTIEYAKKYAQKEATIVTKDLTSSKVIEGVRVKYIPLWRWLIES